ncbi:hypothetical protein CIT26_29815 [Mesorhizobium temperatum]|uniref:Uncharacterized protein n=1 Tax=Mesorhizobium temperatum TaxID=241416 RepID=A0A271LE65_9HYPH|nr:hypothetical protein [Mesorhizobium temperatum]PAQ05548.1 hypothetical protein CIT26_29815 [Mesorhizobium temperatum]
MLLCALIGLAWLVRARTVRSLSPLAPLMQLATNRLRWGEHRGGMFVEVAGSDQTGVAVTRSWHLLAEGNDGPLIPSMAVEALVRKALDGHEAPPGARAAVHDLELEDYEALFASKTIYTGFRNEPVDLDTPLYAALLGDAWLSLPDEIRAMHDGTTTAEGRARVERGGTILGRLTAWLVGFRSRAPIFPSVSGLKPARMARPGPGHSARTVFQADSTLAGTGRSGCCANASAR